MRTWLYNLGIVLNTFYEAEDDSISSILVSPLLFYNSCGFSVCSKMSNKLIQFVFPKSFLTGNKGVNVLTS